MLQMGHPEFLLQLSQWGDLPADNYNTISWYANGGCEGCSGHLGIGLSVLVRD